MCKKILKKAITSALILLIFTFFLEAKPVDNLKQYTLENGLEVFLLEDSNDALVHIKFSTKAGFSSQTQENSGFFKLYTELIKATNPEINFTQAQCNADSSEYATTIAPGELKKTLYNLSNGFFSPDFTNETINKELEKLKKQSKTAAEDMSVYINSAIDSKVFSESPWKHDSGIYPPVFKKIPLEQARNYIKNISDNWYIPENSALFIYGNINLEKTKDLIEKTFGIFYSSNKTPVSKPLKPVNSQRKFILHDPELSPDLTQVVIQYTSLNMEENDILALSLNNNSSLFKQKILERENLNIPGDEYINIDSAHQKGNSRLIIQTLLEKNENSTSLEQVLDFYNQVLQIPESFLPQEEFIQGKNFLQKDMDKIIASPKNLMENLSSFWAISHYRKTTDEDYTKSKTSPLLSLMVSRKDKINKINYKDTLNLLKSENPFVFVIINTKDYNKNKKSYKKAGFQEITPENSSWYVQEIYKEIKNNKEINYNSQIHLSADKDLNKDNNYFEKNLSEIKETNLNNGIKVITKKNSEAPDICLLLSIKGGSLNSPENNGFEEVMINILSSLIEKEIYSRQNQGLIISEVNISTETQLSTSSILINFQKEDTLQICEALEKAIIYGEIYPAMADKEVSLKQYKKRLENGNPVNQMYSAGIIEITGQEDLAKIFATDKEILLETNYISILTAYPELLDPGRYAVIITGDFSDNIISHLNKTLGLLAENHIPLHKEKNLYNFPENKSLKVKIVHTFLTDIPKEKAGPQPAELIPTTEFLDPVMYFINAPEYGTKESGIFKSFVQYLEKALQEEVDKNPRLENTNVIVELPKSKTNFATVTFTNVKHIKEVDNIYKTVILKLSEELSSVQGYKTVENIKNTWILTQLHNTSTSSGTAKLIYQGLAQFPNKPQGDFYLQEYNTIQNASAQEYINILKYFPPIPDFRIYSETGKN